MVKEQVDQLLETDSIARATAKAVEKASGY